ncbi:MAG: hypothetical protein AAGC79_00790 [Pseudomonadota bacterium]
MEKFSIRILTFVSILALATTSAHSEGWQELHFAPLHPSSKELENFSLLLKREDDDLVASISNKRGRSYSEITLKYKCSLGLNICRLVADSNANFGIMVRLLDHELRDYQASQIEFCEIDLIMTFAAYYQLQRLDWNVFLSEGIVTSNSYNIVPDFTGIETWKRISEGC